MEATYTLSRNNRKMDTTEEKEQVYIVPKDLNLAISQK